MPDEPFDLAATRARQEAARQAALAESPPDEPTPTERAQAIHNCPLCDSDGYRQLVVCDHTDRTETTHTGIARVRAAMGWTPKETP